MDNQDRDKLNQKGSTGKEELNRNKSSEPGKNKGDSSAGFGSDPRKSGQEQEGGVTSPRSGPNQGESERDRSRNDS